MKISIVNGSPKAEASTSRLMIEYLTPFIGNNEITVYSIGKKDLTNAQFADMQNSEALIFVFPLYIDSVPSNVLRLLARLERQGFADKKPQVYCIINNGFFEGKQNHIAFDIMKNWCRAVGLRWGQGVGLGAGEMLPFLKDIPPGHGPNKNMGKAFEELAKNVSALKSGGDLFVSPNYPRFLWKISASLYFWYPKAKKNGLKRKEIR